MDTQIHQILCCLTELIIFMIFPDISFHHPDTVQVLLDAGIQAVIPPKHLIEDRERPPDNKRNDQPKENQGCQKDQGNFYINPHTHDQGRNHHDRCPYKHTNQHLVCVLHVGNIRSHTGNQTCCGEMVNIPECKILNIIKHSPP